MRGKGKAMPARQDLEVGQVESRREENTLGRSSRAANLSDLVNNGLKIRERHGPWPTRFDQLQHVSIGHVFHATEIGHHHRHGPSHSSPTTHHDPIVCDMPLHPIDCFGQLPPVHLAEFFERNPSIDQPWRSFDGEFLSNEKHRPYLGWRLRCIVDGADK